MNACRRLAGAFALAAGLSLAAPFAVASAAVAPLEITTPPNGGYTRESQPRIAGMAEDTVSPVTVELIGGEGVTVLPPVKPSPSGAWSVRPGEALPPGVYTAHAVQEIVFPLAEATSTFTVDTSAPHVTIAPNPSPSTDMTPAFSGGAGTDLGDLPQITVTVYAGSAPAGAPAAILHTNAIGASWSTGPSPALPEGEYTAVAEQSDLAGNVGRSESDTFILASVQKPPTASFTWVPANPQVGQAVTLVSTSLGGSSAIVSYSWDPTGVGPFIAGGPVYTTTFKSAGAHLVRLLVGDARGNTALARATIHVGASHAATMQPFPIVRIAGTVTPRGARIGLLSVQAPPGALVTIRCRGRGCRVKSQSRVVRATATSARTGMSPLVFSRFERSLPGGTVLRIYVTRSGELGKYTSFLIRTARLPVRSDACVASSSSRPVACPSS
jgi:Bacterial Ig-like domain/PKD domain